MLKRLFLFMTMLVTTAVYAGSPDQVVNEVMQGYLQQHDIPGAAVIVYVDGKPSTYYYGVADRETKKPITKDTIFELGSITKLMTSLLLAQEVDFAKIKLKEPINKYIPTCRPPSRPSPCAVLRRIPLACHSRHRKILKAAMNGKNMPQP